MAIIVVTIVIIVVLRIRCVHGAVKTLALSGMSSLSKYLMICLWDYSSQRQFYGTHLCCAREIHFLFFYSSSMEQQVALAKIIIDWISCAMYWHCFRCVCQSICFEAMGHSEKCTISYDGK